MRGNMVLHRGLLGDSMNVLAALILARFDALEHSGAQLLVRSACFISWLDVDFIVIIIDVSLVTG